MKIGFYSNEYQTSNSGKAINLFVKDAVPSASGNNEPVSQAVSKPAEQKPAAGPAIHSSEEEKMLKKLGVIECSTCSSRQYVDGSDDAGVSFKTPTHVSPEASNAAVVSHEQEHVARESSKASAEDRQVVSQSVQIYMDTCPECGRVYTSGGKTTTTTKGAEKTSDFFMDQMKKFFEGQFGKEIDLKI